MVFYLFYFVEEGVANNPFITMISNVSILKIAESYS